MPITKKQKEVFDYIVSYFEAHSYAPTQREILEHFGFKSFGSVQKYLQYLSNAGYLKVEWNSKRGIELLKSGGQSLSQEIPLLGKVAAGLPLEAKFSGQTFPVPSELMAKKNQYFVVEVQGDSMIEAGILEGDFLVVAQKDQAENGETVIAEIDNEATVKKFFRRHGQIELEAANSKYENQVYQSGNLKIRGVVAALIRQY